MHRIWMDDNRPPAQGDFMQGVDGDGFEFTVHNTGCVKSRVSKLS